MKKEVKFSIPTYLGNEKRFIKKCIKNKKISGDGYFSKKCCEWFENNYKTKKALLTTSCTHALELSAKICDIGPGDEVIVPDFTYCATANAFINSGARVKFIDVKKESMNIDYRLIESAISSKTKAIVIVHYAGVSCDMDAIMKIAKKYKLYLIEDAAQAIGSTYKGKYLGTIGDLGCFSFHDTKNLTMGEGGALLINNDKLIKKAIVISDNGNDREDYLKGLVDKYSWDMVGASYLASDLNAAYLYPQLLSIDKILKKRLKCWNLYNNLLAPLEELGCIELNKINSDCCHNGHIFYLKTKDKTIAKKLSEYLKNVGIKTAFHYTALHTTKVGKKYGSYISNENVSTTDSERLLRLPLYYGLKKRDIHYIVKNIYEFYGVRLNEK